MSTIREPNRSTANQDIGLSVAVVRTVSDATERPVSELPPLYEAIDPDALEAAFRGREGDGLIQFRYADQVVTVNADRTIEVSTS